MKNRVKKVLMLTGILCVMGITLCACQGTKEVSDENQNQEEIGGTDSKERISQMKIRNRKIQVKQILKMMRQITL